MSDEVMKHVILAVDPYEVKTAIGDKNGDPFPNREACEAHIEKLKDGYYASHFTPIPVLSFPKEETEEDEEAEFEA